MSKSKEEAAELRRLQQDLIVTGMDVGLVHAAAKFHGTATPEVEKRLTDLAERNAAALQNVSNALVGAGMEHLDPETFARRVRLRRRMDALRRRRKTAKKTVPAKPLLGETNAADAPPVPASGQVVPTRVVRR